MNHLKDKRVHSVADLLQDQCGLALVHLENAISILVTTDVFALLTPPKESILDLSNQYWTPRTGHWGSLEISILRFYEISKRSKGKEAQMVYPSPRRDE
ncbi:unnamed protein product [Spirodela intermedia]|uniref:Uncharacterized protein n=1 Tax=Spirodela intermedia TaxID=51605 RepID=A0A7I8J2Y9_SPIIN|nr:unnamed protein product [Spirodela intermedia]CAA6664477.1 unnamed protein product [Spirodela intermedia]